MNQKLMHLDNLYDFSLVRYEPDSIILIDKISRKPYEFYQTNNMTNLKPEIQHPYLSRPILYKNGILYARGCETLATLVQMRRRNYNPSKYSVEEVLNTFEPILQCLEYLHQKNIFYGNLSAEHIVFYDTGDILLKDWLFNRPESEELIEYSRNKDMKRLGQILSSVATLMPQKQLKKLSYAELSSLMMESYSSNFCAAVLILLQGHSKYFSSVLSLLGNQNNQVKVLQVKSIIDEACSLKSQKEREKQKSAQSFRNKQKLLKEVQNEKSKIETPRKQQQKNQSIANIAGSLQGSPTKKFNITTPNKKVIRLEDCENKKVFNDEVKKRQIEKITKIIERSNAFVNELMARKNNDKKYLNSAKVNSSMIETQQNSKKTVLFKESPKISSPTKRLRSISKKK